MSTQVQRSHSRLVSDLAKNGQHIITDLNPTKAHLLHMAVGLAGEVGEVIDALKRHSIYGKPLDRTNVIEELGDIEFYLEGIRAALDISRDRVIEANIAKLRKRYPEGVYTNVAAIVRADKT